ncbi:MAG: HPr family phosphocarrier protein [Lachnospiraceae bacterium]|jgi:catabolite repression HPr-like protein|nr:HPr family phosphocarrier protein [Lachnospiraceae bacterium]
MIRETIKVERNLENNPIAHLVQEASNYSSSIYIEVSNKSINAKSIMGMMTLNLKNGNELSVSADGVDEEAAMLGIKKFLIGK